MQNVIKHRRKIAEIRKEMIEINKQEPSDEELDHLVDILNTLQFSNCISTPAEASRDGLFGEKD